MKKKEETRRFESETLALPPLKMVLVNTDSDRRNRPSKKNSVTQKSQASLENLKAVIKLIDHLSEEE